MCEMALLRFPSVRRNRRLGGSLARKVQRTKFKSFKFQVRNFKVPNNLSIVQNSLLKSYSKPMLKDRILNIIIFLLCNKLLVSSIYIQNKFMCDISLLFSYFLKKNITFANGI